MKKVANKSYNRIMDYIKNEENINEEKKRLLVKYATLLYVNNIENVEFESINDIAKSIKCITVELQKGIDNQITTNRLKKTAIIISELCDRLDSKSLDLSEISYEIDKMYLDLNLPIRKSSSLSYNLSKINRKGR